MRDYDPQLENAFYEGCGDYLNLERKGPNKYFSNAYSLERMDELAEAAGNPQADLRIIHVAGTKGKGSTCMFTGALLNAAGFKVGTFCSPHLTTIRERFMINNELPSYESLLHNMRTLVDSVKQSGLEPTFFEILTVVALQLFRAEKCEIAILETGIGGLLDATNFIPAPECCAITSISRDHTHLLGESIAEITEQKAGIIKQRVPLVFSRQVYSEAERIIRDRAVQRGAPAFPSAPPVYSHGWGQETLPSFQLENFATALTVCQTLGIQPFRERYREPPLRGRCETIQEEPPVVIDAAHNADSARHAVNAIKEKYPGRNFLIVLAVASGKDVEGIFRELMKLSTDFILTNPACDFKGSALSELTVFAEKQDACLTYQVREKIESRDVLPSDVPLLFTGSFFSALLGEQLFQA